MYNIIKQYIRTAGEYTEVADGNIMVNAPGVTLKNVTINGDLIIGDGVGDGDLLLENVTVKGRLVARGGGANSIVIRGGSVVGKVVIAKVDGNIRVSVEGGAEVEVIVVDDGKDDVIIEGTVGTVQVAAAVPVAIQNATIETVEVSCEGAAEIKVSEGAKVTSVLVSDKAEGSAINVSGQVTNVETSAANTVVSGTGTVRKVTAKEGADGTSVTTRNTEVANQGASNVTAGGKEVPKNGSETSSGGSGTVTPPSGGSSEPEKVTITGVSITGNAVVGSILTAVPSPEEATVTYQWMISDTEDDGYSNIAGATSNAYTLDAGDLGKYIKVTVTGTGRYTGTVTSEATATVRASVAQIGPTHYGSLHEAVNAATDGDTIKLTADVTLSDTIYVDKTITLDLNGHTLRTGLAEIISVGSNVGGTGIIPGNLTIEDSVGTGRITAEAYVIPDVITILPSNSVSVNYGTLTIEGGTFTGNYSEARWQ